MRKRNTKGTLFGSLLTLLLCCSMLLGSTFAWFVDSKTAGVVGIKSGSLDLDIAYALQPKAGEALQWIPVNDKDNNFFGEHPLWAPDFTGIVYIKVTNTGKLALKYRCSLGVSNNVVGKNQSNADIDLTRYIKAGVTTPNKASENSVDEPLFTDRNAALNALGGEGSMSALNSQNLVWEDDGSTPANIARVLKKGESQYFAVVLHMPNSTGNEANYAGVPENKPSFELKITVDATQASVEVDSFNNDYDATAPYPTETTELTEENEETDTVSEDKPADTADMSSDTQ